MKNRAFLLGAAIAALALAVDVILILQGLEVLGVLSLLGTVLVFASAIVWLIYQDDAALHFRKPWLIVPLAIFGVAVARMLQESGIDILEANENIQEVGSLLMSRYELGLWAVSSVLLVVFVIAASLMVRRRA